MSESKAVQDPNGGQGSDLQHSDSGALLHVISQAARDPSVDVDKLDRMLQMHLQLETRQAEQQFNRSFARAQQEMAPISADATNPQTRSRYATYAQIDRALRPIYSRHGFAVSFDQEDSPKEDHIRVVAVLSHVDGHSRRYRRDIPVTTTGIKGKSNMTPTHADASAQSYAMRYLLRMIWNVAIGEGDDDGNAAGAEPVERITESEAADLRAKCEELDVDMGQFERWLSSSLKVPEGKIEHIPRKALPDVDAMLERKRSKA